MKKINILELDHDTAVDVITTLYEYDACHIEHRKGRDYVATSYALKSRYDEDEWISEEITRKDLHINFQSWELWDSMTSGWEFLKDEERLALRTAYDIVLKGRAEKDLSGIQYLNS